MMCKSLNPNTEMRDVCEKSFHSMLQKFVDCSRISLHSNEREQNILVNLATQMIGSMNSLWDAWVALFDLKNLHI